MGSFADPVFVLCNGRSGWTLLRFLLDAHPDLACPPETKLPGLCVRLATVWSLIEGAPLSANGGDEAPEIPEAAIAGVRETMDQMVGSYLAEHFADKCFRLRYEDLVADPEETAAELFEFLGVPAAPGVSQRCFSAEPERLGPADYKKRDYPRPALDGQIPQVYSQCARQGASGEALT